MGGSPDAHCGRYIFIIIKLMEVHPIKERIHENGVKTLVSSLNHLSKGEMSLFIVRKAVFCGKGITEKTTNGTDLTIVYVGRPFLILLINYKDEPCFPASQNFILTHFC